MTWLNSLAPGKFEWNFRYVIFKWNLVVAGWGISCEIALIRMSLDFTDDQSTLVQVMAWCRQATSHYLSQCWPRSLSPYGVTRPQWIKDSVSTSNMVVNSLRLCNAFLHRSPMSSLVQIITCCLFDTKPLSEPMLDYLIGLVIKNILQWNLNQKAIIFIQGNAFENVCKMAAILCLPPCVNVSPAILAGVALPLDYMDKSTQHIHTA